MVLVAVVQVGQAVLLLHGLLVVQAVQGSLVILQEHQEYMALGVVVLVIKLM
jgi:hypothetical protein